MAKRDNAKAARVLAEAAFVKDDVQVLGKFKISLRTLYNWRDALRTDAELARLFAEACAELEKRDWADELTFALSAGVRHLQTLILGARSSDPETIQAVTNAVLGMAEIAMTRDMLAARLRESEHLPALPAAPLHALN